MSKILIMSQDMHFTKMLKYTLTYHGFMIETAPNIQTGWKLLQEVNFDLVLMDVHFKDGSGIEFSKELRRCGLIASLIMMGECYDEISILESMKHGMDDFILKPFGMSELKNMINRQLELKRLLRMPIMLGDLTIDVARSMVIVKDKIISLGKKEMEALLIMVRKAGRIVAPDKLITENRMRSLHRKLKEGAGGALQIKFVGGLGYRLVS